MNLITKAHLEGVKMFNENYPNVIKAPHDSHWVYGAPSPHSLKLFLTTYTENLLKAVKEAGPRERTVWGIEQQKWSNEGFNSCISSFHSAIDEGIEGIKKGKI